MYYQHTNTICEKNTQSNILYSKRMTAIRPSLPDLRLSFKNQLNQKFKLIVENPRIGLYSNMSPHANVLWILQRLVLTYAINQ